MQITLIFFHLNQSMPFADKVDHQGEYYRLTLWEQLDDGAQFSPTRKFLTAVPVLIFLLSIHMTNYDAFSFALNFISLLVVLVPKFPAMHGQRILGINKR
ncbi:hypothetical protein H696_01909 [Fonticula alba]|uniref:ORMDL family protein n=1 Tax=Fonticula alba TaxID=691883 RepID=A0A058ZC10_FONAL|nr:hypothetical protein H696_01909 [Fonticula alba]KCV70962.1 hypothetical protein H696_01909 [Fonticula alba]|eukprot:XP_009494085.1 hypothetical protein H696_01909 [Fonticula alba]